MSLVIWREALNEVHSERLNKQNPLLLLKCSDFCSIHKKKNKRDNEVRELTWLKNNLGYFQ